MVRSFFFSRRKPSADETVLLMVDGYFSHNKNLDVVDKISEHNVALVSLPPHSTHKLQPLDFGIMKPLKNVIHRQLKRG